MSKVLEYKGFQGSAEYDLEGEYLYGKVLHITDLVDYSADTISDLKQEFQLAVDDYLEMCAELGCEPNKPSSGSFNVRVGPDVHSSAVRAAAKKGISLNEFVKSAIEEACATKQLNHEVHFHLHRTESSGTEFKVEIPVKLHSPAAPLFSFEKLPQGELH